MTRRAVKTRLLLAWCIALMDRTVFAVLYDLHMSHRATWMHINFGETSSLTLVVRWLNSRQQRSLKCDVFSSDRSQVNQSTPQKQILITQVWNIFMRDAPKPIPMLILIPVSDIGTNTGVEWSTYTQKMRADARTQTAIISVCIWQFC